MIRSNILAALLAGMTLAAARDKPDLSEVVKRLDRLEAQNRELMEEVRALRKQLASTQPPAAPQQPSEPPVDEQVAVQAHRIDELDQTKVGAEHKLPIWLTGTVLFNAFLNGRHSGDSMDPITATPAIGMASAGASLRQTILGFRFGGPDLPGGGKASGTILFDFFAGTGTSLNQLVRLRVATLDLAWKNTTFTVGQDKPIFAPREPDSLAQVGLSPLTGAGNLWIWQPQARIEQRFRFTDRSGVNARVGVYETNEAGGGVPSQYAGSTSHARPGLEGRFNFWAGEENGRRFEIAPGFHVSQTHTLGQSVPSRVLSVDWLLRPFSKFDFTGQVFQGENVGVVGGLQQGVSVEHGSAAPVRSLGGWAQFTYRATPRLWFNIYGGQEDDRNSDLYGNAIGKNEAYAANLMYRFGSNVLTSFEYSRVRTTWLNSGTVINPHYDLAIAYLF